MAVPVGTSNFCPRSSSGSWYRGVAMGVGVASSLRAGVRMGTYEAGGSRILYPSLGSSASSSSSVIGRLRSSISRSHRWALYCSGVMGTFMRAAICAAEGVSIPSAPMGVMPGVKLGVAPPEKLGVMPTLGVALPIDAGVSSHRDRLRFGVGVAMLFGVASHRPGVACPGVTPPGVNPPGVTPPRPGVASPSASRPGVGVSSQRFRLAGVASPKSRPGVGVASQRLAFGVASGISHSDIFAFFVGSAATEAPPWSHLFRLFSPVAGCAAATGAGATGTGAAPSWARVGCASSAARRASSSFFF
mmetsp:Transcript_8558/g.17751  ORF Transcript_8558/g.17751 Transcript_8558/m.17751 type:complete len:303 (+) Transcript_8558:2765-3673(+)